MQFKSKLPSSLASIFVVLTSFHAAFAGPWAGFGRTSKTINYLDDSGSDLNYQFGVKEAFIGYSEPDLNEARFIPNPLEDFRYSTYDVIVVINDNEIEPYPELNGKPQTMRVYSRNHIQNNGLLYYWSISTGRTSASTRKGYYRPKSFSSRHWSTNYDAPMLWSVFFDGGRALHSSMSTDDLQLLGKRKSSHGCVHVEDHRAEELFHLIGQSGKDEVAVIDSYGDPVLGSDGYFKTVYDYKTLIIVR